MFEIRFDLIMFSVLFAESQLSHGRFVMHQYPAMNSIYLNHGSRT